MPVPSTNCTSHFNASDADHLWVNADHTGVPPHNSLVTLWDDDDARAFTFIPDYDGASYVPHFNLTSPVMPLPSLKFDAALTPPSSMTLYTYTISGAVPLTSLISASAFLVGVSFRIFACSTNDAAPIYNEGLLTDDSGLWGIYIRNAAGVVSLFFVNNDIGATPNFLIGGLALNTDYVLLFWRTGGAIFGEVHSAAGLVGSGNATNGVAALGTRVYLGRNAGGSVHSSIYYGEIATYNAYVGADKTALGSFLTGKWLGAAPPPTAPSLGTMTPASAYANASVPVKLTGVAFTGASGLDGTGGAFDTISGFTFSNLIVASGGASATVDITIAAAKTPGTYNFTYTTSGGSSTGTSAAVIFTVLNPSGGTAGDTGGNVRFNAGFN